MLKLSWNNKSGFLCFACTIWLFLQAITLLLPFQLINTSLYVIRNRTRQEVVVRPSARHPYGAKVVERSHSEDGIVWFALCESLINNIFNKSGGFSNRVMRSGTTELHLGRGNFWPGLSKPSNSLMRIRHSFIRSKCVVACPLEQHYPKFGLVFEEWVKRSAIQCFAPHNLHSTPYHGSPACHSIQRWSQVQQQHRAHPFADFSYESDCTEYVLLMMLSFFSGPNSPLLYILSHCVGALVIR